MPKEKKLRPPQHQKRQPGLEFKMRPKPIGGERLVAPDKCGRVALITVGSGIAARCGSSRKKGRTSIVYFNALKTRGRDKRLVESQGRQCCHRRDIGAGNSRCLEAKERDLGKSTSVNNAAEHIPGKHHEDHGEAARKTFAPIFSRCFF